MAEEISLMASMFGISPIVFFVAIVWSLIWKAIALWKSARHKHLVWFIVFLVVNTMGIIEILYIFLFSKLHLEAEATEKAHASRAGRKARAKPRAKRRR